LSLIKKRSANEVRSLLTEIVDACKVPVVIAGGPTAREHLKAVYAAGAEFAETADELTLAIEKKRS
jgi:NAD(P)H-dependent flavin oxidoreductase YrpB (nitropropane dioxygenase family)